MTGSGTEYPILAQVGERVLSERCTERSGISEDTWCLINQFERLKSLTHRQTPGAFLRTSFSHMFRSLAFSSQSSRPWIPRWPCFSCPRNYSLCFKFVDFSRCIWKTRDLWSRISRDVSPSFIVSTSWSYSHVALTTRQLFSTPQTLLDYLWICCRYWHRSWPIWSLSLRHPGGLSHIGYFGGSVEIFFTFYKTC